eukprot:1674006-Heterocapsa_arctica.AAC.1
MPVGKSVMGLCSFKPESDANLSRFSLTSSGACCQGKITFLNIPNSSLVSAHFTASTSKLSTSAITDA